MSVYIFALGVKSANGLVKSTINTANALVRQGVETSLINILGKEGGFDFLDPAFFLSSKVKRFSLDALSYTYADYTQSEELFYEISQRFLKVRYYRRHSDALKSINEVLGPNDLLIFSHPMAMAVFFEANKSTKAKTVVQVHGNHKQETENFGITTEYVDKVDWVQAVSEIMAKDLSGHPDISPGKVVFIPNISVSQSIQKKTSNVLKRVSIIGSVQDRKNQIDAVKMLSCLEDRNIILQVYGNVLDLQYKNRINQIIKMYGLSDRVVFKGVVSEQEVYENTDIAIMTSKHEGFGYIFLECSLYGIPVVSYDFDYGAKEFLGNAANDVCLVDYGDYKKMAEVVSCLFDDTNMYKDVVDKNKSAYQDYYSEDVIVDGYCGLFKNKNRQASIPDFSSVSRGASIGFSKKTCRTIKRLVRPSWSDKESGVDEQIWYELQFYTDRRLEKDKFFFSYKKSRLEIPAENVELSYEKSRGGIFFLPGKTKTRVSVSFPSFCRLSDHKPMRRVDVFYKSRRAHVARIIDGKLNVGLHDGIKTFNEYAGEFSVSNIQHILRPDGFWIRYPAFEAIRKIEDGDGGEKFYETKNIKFDGIIYPFFKLKSGLHDRLSITMNSGAVATLDFNGVSYKSVFQSMQKMEAENSLFDLRVAGVYVWELVRATIFENILEAYGVLDKHFGNPMPVDYAYYGDKDMFNLPSRSKLLIEFPRKGMEDYRTVAIQRAYDEDLVVLEYPQEHGYSDRSYDESSNVYPIKGYLDYSYKPASGEAFSVDDKKKIRWISSLLKSVFGLRVEVSSYVRKRLIKFNREFCFFNDYFSRNDFDEVFIPSAYWSAGIVSAAKRNGVIVSDVQYALISKYHPSFSFPVSARAYGADRIYLWSKYWNLKEAPYNKSVVLDANYFTCRLSDGSDVSKSQDIDADVVFVGQSRIGLRLFEFAARFARLNGDGKVVYCPHPDEDVRKYKGRGAFDSPLNLHVADANRGTLQYVMAASVVVGVYSTSLIEAVALGKDTYCVKLSGYEVLERECELGYVNLVDSPEQIRHVSSSTAGSPNLKPFYA